MDCLKYSVDGCRNYFVNEYILVRIHRPIRAVQRFEIVSGGIVIILEWGQAV